MNPLPIPGMGPAIEPASAAAAEPTKNAAAIDGLDNEGSDDSNARFVRHVAQSTDAIDLGKRQTTAIKRQDSTSSAPSLIPRSTASGVECYASVDGHWILSTCAPPSATSS